MDAGVSVGLGTDVSGGYSSSMMDCIRMTYVASKATSFHHPEYKPLTLKECFWLATMGGARALDLEHSIGSFSVGKDVCDLVMYLYDDQLDALVISPNVQGSPFDCFVHDSAEDIFSKFLLNGDDRNITQVLVNGKTIKSL